MPTPRAAGRDRKVHGDRGFTLTETLVSLTLLTLVGGGATTGVVAGIRTQATNESRTAAANLVRADLDLARTVEFPASPPPVATHNETVGTRTFALTRTVRATDGSGSAVCPDVITSTGVLALLVTSTATWDNARSSVSMSTVISC